MITAARTQSGREMIDHMLETVAGNISGFLRMPSCFALIGYVIGLVIRLRQPWLCCYKSWICLIRISIKHQPCNFTIFMLSSLSKRRYFLWGAVEELDTQENIETVFANKSLFRLVLCECGRRHRVLEVKFTSVLIWQNKDKERYFSGQYGEVCWHRRRQFLGNHHGPLG